MEKRSKNRKSAQVVGEVLMKISGILLVMTLVLVVLVKYEVVNLTWEPYIKYLPKSCLLKSGLECIDNADITKDGLVFQIINNEGFDIRLDAFDITLKHPQNATCGSIMFKDGASFNEKTPFTLRARSNNTAKLDCDGLTSGDYFEADTNYGLVNLARGSIFSVKGKIIGGIN